MIFLEELEKRKAYIEKGLEVQLGKLKGVIPDQLFESMEYSLLAGGKRIRPVLLLEMASLRQSDKNRSLPLAMAMEMIHTYSLVHDDLPAMDNDSLRRGKPTNHVVYGEQVAILAGDGLLNFAYETMLNGMPKQDWEPYIQGMRMIADAAGALGMVGGQTDDIQNDAATQDIALLEGINKRKTGALIKASVMAGACMAGMDKESMEKLEEFSEHIGLAFQIVDDILDVEGDEALIGKHTGNDLENNKITYPAYYGLERAKEMVAELHKKSLDCLRQAGADTQFMVELTGFICHRAY